jgi:cell wall-associated NlpC family hydrolase
MSRVPRDLAAPEAWEASLNRSRARRRSGGLRKATKGLNRSFSAVSRAASSPQIVQLWPLRTRATAVPVGARQASSFARARDLADLELWELSLGRSRARRRAAELRFVPTGSRAKRISIGTLAALSVGPASSLAQTNAAGGGRGRPSASPPTTSEHVITLESGSTGAQVRKLQTALHIKADGDYGPETEDAVYQYQATHGLAVDGVVGPKTSDALASDAPTKAPSGSDAIKMVQAALGLQVDGEYGPETYEAIKAFQESRNINVDEVVGPQTWHALHMTVDQTLSPPASAIPQPKVIPAVMESGGGEVHTEGAPEGAPAPQGEGAPVARMASADGGEGEGGTEAPQEAPAEAPAAAAPASEGGGESHTEESHSEAPHPSGEGEGNGGGEGSGTVRRVIAAGNEIATRPYVYGGGHGSFNSNGYDCSGSVSYALHGAGLIHSPETSGELEHYGESGPGKHITIYANSEHTYMEVNGRRYDTVALAEHGSRWSNSHGSDGGSFVVRHPAGQ